MGLMTMRILKADGMLLLKQEAEELTQHAQLCRQQEEQLRSFKVNGMSGKAGTKAGEVIRMRSAAAGSLGLFCRELAAADQMNMQLVSALPETSAGVLDTKVAEQNIADAEIRLKRANASMADDLARLAAEIRTGQVVPGSSAQKTSSDVRAKYRGAINEAKAEIKANQKILDAAEQYSQESSMLYHAVNLVPIQGLRESVFTFKRDGSWGESKWVDEYRNGLTTSVLCDVPAPTHHVSVVTSAVSTTVEVTRGKQAVVERSVEMDTKVGDTDVTKEWQTKRTTHLNTPNGPEPETKDFSDKTTSTLYSVGITGSLSTSAIRGEASNTWSLLGLGVDTAANVRLGNATVSGEGVFSVTGEGDGYAPELKAGLSVEGSLLEADGKVSIGDEYNGASLEGQVKLSSYSADAELSLSNEGFKAEVGAEYYLFKGEISGELEFLGIKVTSKDALKFGGAGAKASFEMGLNDFDLSASVGVGIGYEKKLGVDWSGMPDAIQSFNLNMDDWWVDGR
jgi:hypothetical protein